MIPEGYEIQVRPRSGLAIRHGITMVNSPGTIDSDFRGEIKILMINLGSDVVTLSKGEWGRTSSHSPKVNASPNWSWLPWCGPSS